MGKLKVGDKVRSLVTQIDVRAGKLYEAARSDADSGVWVIDDVGDQFYLTNEEFEILPVAIPTFEVGDRVQTIADSLPWYRAGEVAEVVIADGGDDDCFVRFNSDRMASDSWYVKWKHIQLAPLKIEAGKYYRTRDGRKVGPMNAAESEGYAFSGALVGVGYIKIFQSTGVHGSIYIQNEPDFDLIAEWIEEPVKASAPVAVQQDSPELTLKLSFDAVDVTNAIKTTLLKTNQGYGFEIARHGDYVWVDTGKKAPIVLKANDVQAAA
ncbi:hypothetical protein EDF68_10341 [Ochrobactrum sp. BH3]|nr:hypothetical protein EDF68_10341 [Ochrobactrum sp. BH3]